MSIRDLLYETWFSLTANKGRSALTILGVVIGIAAVIAMTALIGGVERTLYKELGLDQSRNIYIFFSADSHPVVTPDDLEEIERSVAGYDFIAGAQMTNSEVTSGSKSAHASIVGAGPHYTKTTGTTVLHGRELSDSEAAGHAMVVVIDGNLSRKLFGNDANPVGKTVSINNNEFSIVGVVEASNMMASDSGTAYIPLMVCEERVSGYEGIDQILGYAEEGVDVASLATATESYLSKRYNLIKEGEDYVGGHLFVQTAQSILDELGTAMTSFQVLMTAVAGISLLVGGIGIMNMMLTNVTERIREIGLRKALGARRSDITMQFLMESIAVCLAGGLIGFILGMAAAFALAGVASSLAAVGEVTPVFNFGTIIMVLGICTLIGVIFGYGPARHAASMDAVEALRHQ